MAGETFSVLRTVASLGAEPKQAEKYKANLVDAQVAGVRKFLRVGFANGLLFSSGNIMAGIGFIYGVKLHNKITNEKLKNTTNET